MKGKIAKMLNDYRGKNRISFSMPGHKCGTSLSYDAFRNDVTELADTDNLYHSEGAVKNACENIAKIYSADESFIMVNGSTGGIFTMLAATLKCGDTVLVSRACHMSVVNACVVLGLNPVFFEHKIYDEYSIYGEADIDDISLKLKENNIKAVLVTSPNYFGVVSDVKGISGLLKNKSIPLLVDEAHGTHFFVGDFLPENAIKLGADMVVQSTHKTLCGLNQSALLHAKYDILDMERVRDTVAFFQTSSPSYPIAASAENAVIKGCEDKEKWKRVYELSKKIKDSIKRKTRIKIPVESDGFFWIDETRLVFNFSEYDITGFGVSDILRDKYNIDVEMADSENIVLIATAENKEEEFQKLEYALEEIVKCINIGRKRDINIPPISPQVVPLSEAFYAEKEEVYIKESVGRISAKVVTVYPPAIPVLTPGVEISKESMEYLLKTDGEIVGAGNGKIYVLKEREEHV